MTWTTLQRSEIGHGLTGWRGGDGPALLLVHGVGLSADAWQPMLVELSQRFSVTAIDLPGHGGSAPLTGAADLAGFAAPVAAVLEDMGGALVVGHSLGALIAMHLALDHGELVKGAVALNAIYRRSDAAAQAVRARADALASGVRGSDDATLARWFDGTKSAHRDACAAMLGACEPRAYAAAYGVFAQSDAPSDATLRSATVPMAFVTGALEPNSTPGMSRALASLVPDGQCIIVEGARHMMPMTHAEDVCAAITRFAQTRGQLHDEV